jgi:hypothetical protein
MLGVNDLEQPLKRRRPKTDWKWYIGTIATSLAVGSLIAYGIHQTNAMTPAKSKSTMNNTTVAIQPIHSTGKLPVAFTKLEQKSTAQSKPVEKVKPVVAKVKTTTPVNTQKQSKPSSTTSSPKQTQISKSTTQPSSSKQIASSQKTTTKPSKNTVLPETKPVKPTQPQPTQPAQPSEPVTEPTTKPKHKGPITQVVNRITGTVYFLLTGKTMPASNK